MKLHQVAARNLQRNRRRTLATAFTIAIGVAALLLFGGYRADLINYMLTSFARSTGHVLVQHVDYFEYGSGNPTLYSFKHADAVRDALIADPELARWVHVATPVLNFPAVAGHAARETSKTVFINGIRPQDHTRMRAWNHYGVRMHLPPHPLDGKGADAALLGMGVARMLQVCEVLPDPAKCGARTQAAPAAPGAVASGAVDADLLDLVALEQGERAASSAGARDRPAPQRAIEVMTATTGGVPNVRSFEAIATERLGLKEMDDAYVVVDYERARSLLFGQGATQASTIALQLHDPADQARAIARATQVLAQRFPGEPLVVRSVSETLSFMGQTVDMFNTIFGFIAVLIVAVVMFTVANTIRTSILERTTEIGTIRALGLRRSTVLQMFLIEAALMSLLGALLGLGVAVLGEFGVNALGLTWQPPNAAEILPLTASVLQQHAMLAGVVLAAVVFATLAAVPAAYKAARLNIVDALRYT